MARAGPARKPRTSGAKTAPARSVLQILVAAVGLAMTLWSAGVILNEALQPARPTALSVSIERERRTPTSRILEIVVTNAGSDTAAAVEVTGTAGAETTSATVDYVPGDGEARAFLSFPPATTGGVDVAVSGWTDP